MKTTIPTLIVGGILAVAVAQPAHAVALLKPSGSQTQALAAKSLSINSKISGAFARTTLTTVYKNPNRRRIEADFIYSAPKGAVVTGFAYWFGQEKVVARVVEKNRAARIYQYITERQQDPALIEMIDKNKFRARIFPVEANQDLKIEIQLAQTLESTPNGLKWNFPLQEETKGGALEKFEMHLQSQDKVASNFGEFSNGKLDFERTNFTADQDLNVQVAQNRAPLRMSLLARRESSASDGFFALSIVPATPIAAPRFKISGVSTYDVLVPTTKRLEAGAPFLVFGRYKGSGKAVVALNNQSAALDFGAGVEQNNAASKLWAQKRIETLSQSERNRFQVVNMSSRFGIVSKWTSWLAIPSAERERFQEEVDQADRRNAGRAYAQAMARGDKQTALAQQKIFVRLNKKLDEDEPLSQTLDAELEIISGSIRAAKRTKVSSSQLAQMKKMQRTLVRLGAKSNTGTYEFAQRTKDEVDKLLPLLVSEIEVGRAHGVRGKKLNNRLRTLGDSRALRLYEGEYYYEETLAQLASERGEEIARILVTERADKRLTTNREAQLMVRLKRVLPLYSEHYSVTLDSQISSVQTQVVMEKTSDVRKKAIEQLKQGVPYEKAVLELDEQWANWEKRVNGRKLDKQNSNNEIRGAAQRMLAAEVLAKRELQPQNIQLAQAIKAVGGRDMMVTDI